MEERIIDQTEEAIKNIRQSVNELLEIDDLKESRSADVQVYNNRILNIISNFNYLKKEKYDSSEYEEAKNLVLSIGRKHAILADWCNKLVDEPVELNNESIVNDTLEPVGSNTNVIASEPIAEPTFNVPTMDTPTFEFTDNVNSTLETVALDGVVEQPVVEGDTNVTSEPVALVGAELNVNNTDELVIKDNAKIEVDAKHAKKLVDIEVSSKEYNKLKFDYKVIVDGKKYKNKVYVEDGNLKNDEDKKCPYRVNLTSWKKNDNGDGILVFNISENI